MEDVVNYTTESDINTRKSGISDMSRSWLEIRYRALKLELHGIEQLLGIESEEVRLRQEVKELRARVRGRRRANGRA